MLTDLSPLSDLEPPVRQQVLDESLELLRKNQPLNIKRNLLWLAVFCFLPAAGLMAIVGFEHMLAWLCMSILITNFYFCHKISESATAYFEQARALVIQKN
jgi:hypothetical protein